MYTVMISEDGIFSAEYVQPPALSIPLGISGSSVEVRRDEDLTFSANKSEYMVNFGTTENTRYGAIALKERVSDEFTPTGETDARVEAAAVHKTRFQYDGATAGNTDDNVAGGSVGAFSYATVADTLRARNLLQTGGAVYTGGTVAATPKEGTLYSGDMRILIEKNQDSD